MPCYCYCDRNHGHKSLRSCFEGTHGANCGTCMQEALYSYRQSKRGWTVKQIRDGIERGDYKMIDLQNVAPVQ
jgi:bacterioferritin-associated ferredoxin